MAIAAHSLVAAPFITPQGVVGAASFTSPSLPGGAIAQGSIFSIFGRELGPVAGEQASAFPLPPQLAGVRITLSQGETAVDAIPLFVRADQINAIMPSNAPLGRVIVCVRFGRVPSNGIPATIVGSNVGLFSISSGGFGPGIVQNVAEDGGRTLNTIQNSAAPGQVLILWGTGLGPALGPDNVAPTTGDLQADTEVFIGGVLVPDADVLYAGRSGCCAGLDQFVVRTPLDAPQGCYVPIEIRTHGALTSNAVTMAINQDGAACSDPANPVGDTFLDPGRVGMILLYRLKMENAVDVPKPVEITGDFALSVTSDQGSSFARLKALAGRHRDQSLPGIYYYNSMVSLPPAGTCQIAPARALGVTEFLPERKLDAGNRFRITGPGGVDVIRLDAINIETIGADLPGAELGRLLLSPGDYEITAFGGSDVGEFQTTVTMPPAVIWENRDEVGVIDRARDLKLDWAALAPENAAVTVMLFTRSDAYKSPSAVICFDDGTAGGTTIPSRLLQSLPTSGVDAFSTSSYVMIGCTPQIHDGEFSADGLDNGIAIGATIVGKTVILE